MSATSSLRILRKGSLVVCVRIGATLSCCGGRRKKRPNLANSLHKTKYDSLEHVADSAPLTNFLGPFSNSKSCSPSPSRAIPLDYESPNSPNSGNPILSSPSTPEAISLCSDRVTIKAESLITVVAKPTFSDSLCLPKGHPFRIHLDKFESFLLSSGYSQEDIFDIMTKAVSVHNERTVARNSSFNLEEVFFDFFKIVEPCPFFTFLGLKNIGSKVYSTKELVDLWFSVFP